MVFSVIWNEARPADTDLANQLGLFIREFKQQVRERMDLEHNFPAADSPLTGQHKAGSAKAFRNVTAAPPPVNPTNPGGLWVPQDNPSLRIDTGLAWDPIASAVNACLVFSPSPNPLTNNSATFLEFNAEAYDTANLHSLVANKSRLTAPVSGIYLIGAHITMTAVGVNDYVELVFNNTASFVKVEGLTAATRVLVTMQLLAANDFMSVRAYQNSGAPAPIAGGFFMFKLGG